MRMRMVQRRPPPQGGGDAEQQGEYVLDRERGAAEEHRRRQSLAEHGGDRPLLGERGTPVPLRATEEIQARYCAGRGRSRP